MQRLEVLVAVMLARERRALADAAADGFTELAVGFATLPSRPLEMIAEALAALGVKFDVERPSGAARNLASPPELQRASGAAPKRERVPMKITAPDGRVRLCSIPLSPVHLPSPMRPSVSVADRVVARLQVVRDGLDMPKTI
jgi:hypothetical protein